MQRVFVYFTLLSPSALLGLGIWSDAFRSTFYLGADPAEYVLETLGQTAAILFLITLLISPLRRLGLVSSALLRFRRPIGVASFFMRWRMPSYSRSFMSDGRRLRWVANS